MLKNIQVQNIALIDEADISLGEGLGVLTGETGAGKSILLGAIGLALGRRGSKDAVRDPSKSAQVSLLFSGISPEILPRLEEMGIDLTDDELMIRRRFTGSKSAITANGTVITAAEARELSSLLIDIHSQHDNQSLLKPSGQMDLLDRFVPDIQEKLELQASLYQKVRKLQEEKALFEEKGKDRERLLSLMGYELQEIEEAALKEGEEEQLIQERKKLLYQERLQEASLSAFGALLGSEDSAYSKLDEAIHQISRVEAYDTDFFSPFLRSLEESRSLVEDIGREFRDYGENAQSDPGRLSALEERYDLIERMKRKYGDTLQKIEAYRARTQEEKRKLEDLDETIRDLDDQIRRQSLALEKHAEALSIDRKRAAAQIEKEITDILATLEFEDPLFTIAVEEGPMGRTGKDKVVFEIRTNVGESLKPLSEIASGGELSRVMLAIKTVLAKQDDIDTLIFDEIDTGISGRTAQSVAEKMALIARYHQVICVTHLPQIAAMADDHLRIEKSSAAGHTATNVYSLKEDEMVEELSRMLGGAVITKAVRDNAAEMKKLALSYKASLGENNPAGENLSKGEMK
ncbi:MAG: DNA repair protein RecN [Firmicutes bacterium]|nr:DNA repair protein RecN [Bacillota bacterium]